MPLSRGPAAALIALAMAAVPAVTEPQASNPPLRVAERVDLNRYAGKWYEVSRLPDTSPERCASEVVAHYVVRPDRRLDIVQRCRDSSGKVDEVRGIGRKAGDQKSSARLEVRFGSGLFSFLPGAWEDYWILALGPDYTWAVVGTPSRKSLWILSRTPQMSALSYERALEVAKANGFDVARLVKTPQKQL